MKLTLDQVRKLEPGKPLVIICDNAAELDSATQTAYKARRELNLTNEELAITRSVTTLTLIVKRIS